MGIKDRLNALEEKVSSGLHISTIDYLKSSNQEQKRILGAMTDEALNQLEKGIEKLQAQPPQDLSTDELEAIIIYDLNARGIPHNIPLSDDELKQIAKNKGGDNGH